ncbi:MAG: hypothetical protein JNL08_14935 [Planctomycetes bacterium]|nr:hypothetical protein [Planctomycetota bacterium]
MRLSHLRRSSPLLVCLFGFAACDAGGREAPPAPAATGRLVLTADTTVLEATAEAPSPAARDAFAAAFPGEAPSAHYRLTTPAGEAFGFDAVTWRDGSAGAASVRVRHLRDGDVDPAGQPDSLPVAGVAPEGRSLTTGDGWVTTSGDGLARIGLEGRIERDQLLVVADDGGALALVELRLGDRSRINRPVRDTEPPTDTVTRQTIYSSDSRWFGMPAVARSGDRTSIVCYEGDRESEFALSRFELRLQHDAATDVVTGGGSTATEADGYWRDHEIAALYNVLAVVRAESTTVRLRLSFDRGATFAQEVELPTSAAQARLVQIGIAADYSLAVAYWRGNATDGTLEFVLVEGRPSAVDATGSPTWFAFDPAQVVHAVPDGSTPLTTGVAWSNGGDLVVGYGATEFVPGQTWLLRTEFRCAVRHWGEALQDRLVDAEEIFGMDPTVALLGSGDTMRIYYAYEARDGLRLAHSSDGGATFAVEGAFGQPGDHLPSVFAREVGGAVRLDVLWLANREQGTELHHARWLAGPTSPREEFALTEAHTEITAATVPVWFGGGGTVRTKQVAWLGFDAVRDGDALVVVYDEETRDAAWCCYGGLVPTSSTTGISVPIFSSPFTAAEPPPLAPGMTEPVPAPNTAHAHQLVLLRIE